MRAGLLTVIRFKDPTKIPLEIVIAAGSRRGAKIMTFVSDLAEAKVVMSVLESGPDGVIMAPRSVAEVEALGRLCDRAWAPGVEGIFGDGGHGCRNGGPRMCGYLLQFFPR